MGGSVKKLVHSVGHSVKYGSQCKKGHTMKNGLHLKKNGSHCKKMRLSMKIGSLFEKRVTIWKMAQSVENGPQ